MKDLYLFLVIFLTSATSFAQFPCVDGMSNGYPCRNMDLMAYMTRQDLGGNSNSNTNDVWGWVSPVTGKEYALVGCSNGTAFVDISEPAQPVYLGLLPTHSDNSLWRDLETYNNYCFIVSEADDHGMQVFDLMELDNVSNPPVFFEETTHYDQFSNCHTLNIDPVSGFAYCNGTNTYSGGLHIVNISNPLSPTLAGGFSTGGYTHDCYAWTYDGPDADYLGKQVVLACNEDDLMIVDVTDKTDCQSIGSYDYNGQAEVGYIHQGWITKDKSHFLIDDELDEMQLGDDNIPYGTRTHMFDITDLDQAEYQGYYEGSSLSIDHNLYVLDQFVYESNYRSGVRVLDAVDVDNGVLSEVGYFDLYPANDFSQFSGTWSNYPYLPSGLVLATSMYDGFFILRPTLITMDQNNWTICGNDEIIFDLQINAQLAFPLTFGVSGLGSAVVTADEATGPGVATLTISGLNSLTSGNYTPMIFLQTTSGEQYEVPIYITVSNNLADSPELIDIPNGSSISNTEPSTLFTWGTVENAETYTFELSSDALFENIIETETTTLTTFLMTYDLPDGQYFWRVKANNGCGDGQWSEVFSFDVLFIGVGEMVRHQLEIYPNPVTDILNISYGAPIQEIVITDCSGRLVTSVHPNGSMQYGLNLESLLPGVYWMKVNGSSAARFVRL